MSVFFLVFCPLKNACKLSFPLHLWAWTEGQKPSEAIRGTQFSWPNLTRDRLYGLSPRGCILYTSFADAQSLSSGIIVGNSPSLMSAFISPPSTGDCPWGREISHERLRALRSPGSESGQCLWHPQTPVPKICAACAGRVTKVAKCQGNISNRESPSICLFPSIYRRVPRPWRGASWCTTQSSGRDNFSKRISSVFCSLSFNTFNSVLEENINHLQ